MVISMFYIEKLAIQFSLINKVIKLIFIVLLPKYINIAQKYTDKKYKTCFL